MRGPTQGARTLAWGEYKAAQPSQSGIQPLSELREGRPVTVALCEANDSFLFGEQPQKVPGIKKKKNGAKPSGFASADAYACICMCVCR